MKNIHVLPTDKPSRLFKTKSVLVFDRVKKVYSENFKEWGEYINQNIYITSDEEIKEGDWFYDLDTKYVKVKQSWENSHLGFNGKKIILTTDQDLIKDGVWGIEDGFLEWFVKNPTCEYVELKGYAIILPGESCDCDSMCGECEAKQEWPESTGDIFSDYVIGESKAIQNSMHLDAEIACRSMYKQETLEDVNTRYHQTAYGNLIKELTKQETTSEYIDRHLVEAMVEIAKQEMYSEEDMKLAFEAGHKKGFSGYPNTENWKELPFKEWFKQFKNK